MPASSRESAGSNTAGELGACGPRPCLGTTALFHPARTVFRKLNTPAPQRDKQGRLRGCSLTQALIALLRTRAHALDMHKVLRLSSRSAWPGASGELAIANKAHLGCLLGRDVARDAAGLPGCSGSSGSSGCSGLLCSSGALGQHLGRHLIGEEWCGVDRQV